MPKSTLNHPPRFLSVNILWQLQVAVTYALVRAKSHAGCDMKRLGDAELMKSSKSGKQK